MRLKLKRFKQNAVDFIRWCVGQEYVLNVKSGVIHHLPTTSNNCMVDSISSKNKKYFTFTKYNKVRLDKRYHRNIRDCKFCNKQVK
jgi:hypothetical protein